MNDAQSTVVGLKSQECPGGGWNGMPAELEGKATVADCLADGSCGCIYGDAVQHIEQLRISLGKLYGQLQGVPVKHPQQGDEREEARELLDSQRSSRGLK